VISCSEKLSLKRLAVNGASTYGVELMPCNRLNSNQKPNFINLGITFVCRLLAFLPIPFGNVPIDHLWLCRSSRPTGPKPNHPEL
jgi:hypothetical protein